MQMRFSGSVDPRVAEDLKRLYLHRAPFYPIVFMALALVALALGWLEAESWAFWLFLAAALTYLALFAPKVAYGRWSRALRGQALAGAVSEEGIELDSRKELLPWRSFVAARIGDRAAILYVSKADGVPLHREFFASDSAWRQASQLASERVKRVQAVAG